MSGLRPLTTFIINFSTKMSGLTPLMIVVGQSCNEFIYEFKCNRDSNYWFDKPIIAINHSINDSLTGAGRNNNRNYGKPIVDMKELLNTIT